MFRQAKWRALRFAVLNAFQVLKNFSSCEEKKKVFFLSWGNSITCCCNINDETVIWIPIAPRIERKQYNILILKV